MKLQLQKDLYQFWLKIAEKNGWEPKLLKKSDILVTHPENLEFGDFSTNLGLVLAFRSKKVKLDQFFDDFLKLFKQQSKLPIAKAKVKNGFLNISVKTSYFLREMEKVLEKKEKYGCLDDLRGKKIMVEYAHPNTHKAFHIGHLRNITNGEAIVRILEALGAKVIKANYQGDVGLHIAKCFWQIRKGGEKKLGSLKSLDEKVAFLGKSYALGNRAFEEGGKAKAEILEINKKIYSQEDKEINQLWKKTRQWSLDYFKRIYDRVYTAFDRLYFESEVAQKGANIVRKALKKGIFKKSRGAIIFPGSKYGLHDRVFITAERNPTYEAKDMELGRLQFEEYKPDLIIHNVGPEQASYFKVIFKALAEVFPETKGKEYHLLYGWVKLKKGKMSSRSGRVVLGEWLLDEAKKKILKAFPEVEGKVAEEIAVGAVKYSFLKVSPPTEVAFDFKESISLKGNSGPYLQYTYARAQSVLRRSKILNLKSKNQILNLKSYKPNNEELGVLRWLYRFPEVVQEAGENYSPNVICNFLYELAQKYNGFYNQHRILGDKDKKVVEFRLGLTKAVGQVLKNGLYFLGIKVPEKM